MYDLDRTVLLSPSCCVSISSRSHMPLLFAGARLDAGLFYNNACTLTAYCGSEKIKNHWAWLTPGSNRGPLPVHEPAQVGSFPLSCLVISGSLVLCWYVLWLPSAISFCEVSVSGCTMFPALHIWVCISAVAFSCGTPTYVFQPHFPVIKSLEMTDDRDIIIAVG